MNFSLFTRASLLLITTAFHTPVLCKAFSSWVILSLPAANKPYGEAHMTPTMEAMLLERYDSYPGSNAFGKMSLLYRETDAQDFRETLPSIQKQQCFGP
ncbi:hypothetical protein GOP47_0014574 [Adiantum capillus-veneris]|uniref:Uncharacterized protein n=1 Tax=Adiantum capillus-veneris TaxID=13818 RepID=A0A9D4UMH7_ADICA|nr:hypothetical protein GOP47_0014574 [Adiantum capillus-veneris]